MDERVADERADGGRKDLDQGASDDLHHAHDDERCHLVPGGRIFPHDDRRHHIVAGHEEVAQRRWNALGVAQEEGAGDLVNLVVTFLATRKGRRLMASSRMAKTESIASLIFALVKSHSQRDSSFYPDTAP